MGRSHPRPARAARDPDHVGDDSGWVDATVEELLHYDVPDLTVGQMAIDDSELEGRCISTPGNRVVPALGGGPARLPTASPSPDQLRLNRRPEPSATSPTACGNRCPRGTPLARVEIARPALGVIATRLPGPSGFAPGDDPSKSRFDPAFRLLDDSTCLGLLSELPITGGRRRCGSAPRRSSSESARTSAGDHGPAARPAWLLNSKWIPPNTRDRPASVAAAEKPG